MTTSGPHDARVDDPATGNAGKINWNENGDFFRFTRGRFVVDEARQMALRTVKFDLNRLAQVAADSVGAEHCIHVDKFPDGMYNKAYLFRMSDGQEVVGRVPNPVAGLPHLTTASEVATMHFMQNVLSTPVPSVLAWNSRAEDDPVGAEYIIMQKAPGTPLSIVWDSLELNERLKVAMKLFRYMKKWSSVSFLQQGSLYFASDEHQTTASDTPLYTRSDGSTEKDSRYRVGPSTGREWVDAGRQAIQCSRGPWDTILQYRRAVGMRERLAVEQLKDMPRNMVMISGPSLYEPSADKKLAALELYDKLLPHLLPNDSALNTSHLWHNDLHHENIFVDPSNPTEITAILDWQSSYIAPLFDHSLVPSVLSSGYGGGVPVGDDLSEPKIPPDYNTLSAHKKRVVMQDIEAQSLLVAWHRLLKVKNPSQYAALRFQDTTIGSLNSIIRRIAEAGEAHFLALLLKLRDEWMVSQHDLPSSSSFPPQSLLDNLISKDVEDRIRQDASDADVGIELMGRLAVLMGDLWPDKGLVTHDDYQKTKDALAQKLEELIRDFATNEDQREAFRRYWPFDD